MGTVGAKTRVSASRRSRTDLAPISKAFTLSARMGPRIMQTSMYCVYNQTNECFLSLGTRLGCDPLGEFKRWFRRKSEVADLGYWLAPMRWFKMLGIFWFHDVIYLNGQHQVIHAVRSAFMPRFARKPQGASTVLILPEQTISASATDVGNQLVICTKEDMESWLRTSVELNSSNKGTRCECNKSAPLNPLEGREATGQRVAGRRGTRSFCSHYRLQGSLAEARIRDVNTSGLYVLTDERWPVGTRVSMTLEIRNPGNRDPATPLRVHLNVVACGPDGLGLEFVRGQQILTLEGDSPLLND
jgi:hypothetical protein